MLRNDDVVSIQNDLKDGSYHQLFSDLRRLGRPIKQEWLKSPAPIEKYKFTANPGFKQFLLEKIKKSNLNDEPTKKDIPQEINQLKKQLSLLSLVLMVWKDDPKLEQESKSEQLPESEPAKRSRQQIKYKSSIDKDDRYAINIALQAMAFILCQQSNKLIKDRENKIIYAKDYALTEEAEINLFKAVDSKQDLLDFISKHIQRLNEFESERYLRVNNEEPLSQQEIEKIGAAIAAFQTPNKKKKLLKYFGIFLALIAALACGLATGGAIILLFPSLSATAFILGGLIAFFGFKANFGFFSKNFSDFLLSLLKKGGITEYIDIEGKRRQFSATYKYLLRPLVIIASLTVGVGTISLTYITVSGLVAKLLPILAIIWPPLPLIIVGVLAVAVGIALTIAVFTASLELLKNVAALNMGFKKLCAHAYKNCVDFFKNLKNLPTRKKVELALMLFLLPIALAGLAYFRYTAGVDLSISIGVAAAIVMGIVAYIPQMAFTYLSINKFKNFLINLFFPTPQVENNPSTKSTLDRVKSVLSKIWYWLGLVINAVGNAVLVFTGSVTSILGAIACALNSLTGNMLAPDVSRAKRNHATQRIVKEYEAFLNPPQVEKNSSVTTYSQSCSTRENDNFDLDYKNMLRSQSTEEPIMAHAFRRRSTTNPGPGTYTPAYFKQSVEKNSGSTEKLPIFAVKHNL